jgi:two-component system, cell cycle sensor histidine kinase and response regulator CckA
MLSEAFADRQVLLIDDEIVIREIGYEMLESLGIPCIMAEDGETGIKKFKESQKDIAIVILDVEMPGLSGDKVYHILRGIDPDLKILITSGYAQNYLESKYFKSKLEHFIPKPFQLNQLSNKLGTMILSN